MHLSSLVQKLFEMNTKDSSDTKCQFLGYSNLAREIHVPAEFNSNPNQAHLSMLINVFRIIRKSQEGEFDQGWS